MSDLHETPSPGLARCGTVDSKRLWAVLALGLAFVLGLGLALIPKAQATGATLVRCEPVTPTGSNATLDVDLYVENVASLYGADVRLSFDPAAAQVVDAVPSTPGVQIQPLNSFLRPDFLVRREANNISGTIWYAATQVNPTLPVTGSGSLARVTFQRVTYGSFQLHFTSQELARRDGTLIPATAQDCTVSFIHGPTIDVQVAPSTLPANTGATAAITATIKDALGNPLSGVVLSGSVDPSTLGTVSGLGATNASGQALGTWTAGSVPGAGELHVTDGSVTGTAVVALNNPIPTISSLNPVSAIAGSPPFVLTVTGANLVGSSTVHWNGSARATVRADDTHLQAVILDTDVITQGTFMVTVVNPAPGGGTSNMLPFTVYSPRHWIYLPIIVRNR